MKLVSTYLAFGSNLGDKEQNIRRAVSRVGQLVGRVEALSSMHITEPWGFLSSNVFVNAAARVCTHLAPHELLAATQAIERELGRTEKSVNGCYHDRLIDIDILMYGDIEVSSPDLTLPHPLMLQRDFVMLPLREVLDAEGCMLLSKIGKNINMRS